MKRYQDTVVRQLKPLSGGGQSRTVGVAASGGQTSSLLRQPTLRPTNREKGAEIEMKRVNFAENANVIISERL